MGQFESSRAIISSALQTWSDTPAAIAGVVHPPRLLWDRAKLYQEKQGFIEAAELAGIPLSSWVRERLRLAAIRELENAGRKIPFVKPIHLERE